LTREFVTGDLSASATSPHPEQNMANEFAIVIGRTARQARQALGLTQEQVAEKLGVSVEFCSRIERGIALPSLKTFVQLAQVLRVDANTLLGLEPANAAAQTPVSGAVGIAPGRR
jgi:transcriptional regulator with XRE-family HTH domain